VRYLMNYFSIKSIVQKGLFAVITEFQHYKCSSV
jgi:hypothetical protein